MEKAEARLILGIPQELPQGEKNEETDFYEEALFTESQYFMRRRFIPKLAEARIKKLEKIILAVEALDLTILETPFLERKPFDGELNEMLTLIQNYHRIEAAIKLHLANTVSAHSAIDAYKYWLEIYDAFGTAFIQQFEKSGAVLSPREVKLSEMPDYNELINELRNGDLNKSVALEYFRLKKIKSS